MVINRIGILYHPMNEAAGAVATELKRFLVAKGVSVWLCSAWEGEKAREQTENTDLILSIGGDGTILRAAQVVISSSIPITGVNLGRLGFMTELRVNEAEGRLSALLAGEGWIDERSTLEVELWDKESEAPQVFHALNDAVVARGAIARLIHVDTFINGQPLTTYKADGVIVATATGSTGYALATGGPILHPRAEEFLLLPILPHLSSGYTLVLPSDNVVKLVVNTLHQATLCVDGHINRPLSNGAVVTVKHSPDKVRFLRIHPEGSFYRSLEQRLKGNN